MNAQAGAQGATDVGCSSGQENDRITRIIVGEDVQRISAIA